MNNKNLKGNKTQKKVTSKTQSNSSHGCQCGCTTPNKQTAKKQKE